MLIDSVSYGTVSPGISSNSPVPRLYRRRWLVLFLFASYSLTNSYQWIHLDIINDKILLYYNASLPPSPYMQSVYVLYFYQSLQ